MSAAAPIVPGTSERILDAALTSFGGRGYEATSLDALAATLGLRKQTILHHFRSKHGLLEAVIDRSGEELSVALEQALAEAGPGFDRIEALVRAVFRLAARRPELLGLLREVSRLGPPAASRLTAALEPLVERARSFLEAEMAAGTLRPQDARLLLLSAYSTVIGVATEVEVLRAVGVAPGARSLLRRRAELIAFLRSALLVDPTPWPASTYPDAMPEARNGEVSIHYETFGDPADPCLLLVNGLGSQCINYRAEWCERFVAEGFFVVRFDNRDVGLSTHFSDVVPDVPGVAAALEEGRTPDVPYLLTDMADDAVAVLDALGVERAHVMGLSMGGMIVQQLALDHPERLRSITSVMSHPGDHDVGRSSPEAEALLFGPPATSREAAVARAVAGLRVWGSPDHLDEERAAAIAGEAFDRCFDPAGVGRQLMAVMAAPSRTEALGSVTVPALVLHGDRDTLIDMSGGRRTADAIPGATFVVIEGMGHDYPPAYWDRWVRLVADHARAADRAAAA